MAQVHTLHHQAVRQGRHRGIAVVQTLPLFTLANGSEWDPYDG